MKPRAKDCFNLTLVRCTYSPCRFIVPRFMESHCDFHKVYFAGIVYIKADTCCETDRLTGYPWPITCNKVSHLYTGKLSVLENDK